jgi:hypothetical protein
LRNAARACRNAPYAVEHCGVGDYFPDQAIRLTSVSGHRPRERKGAGANLNPEATTMIRTLSLAAAAATLIALPASAQSIRVSPVGKSDAQVKAEVFKAARAVCLHQVPFPSFPLVTEYRACVDDTTRNALADESDPAQTSAHHQFVDQWGN